MSYARKKIGTRVGGTTEEYKALAVALNASAANRTMTLDVHDVDYLRVGVAYTYSAATSVTMTPTGSQDGGTSYQALVDEVFTAGAGALSVRTDVFTGTANATWSVLYDVRGLDKLKIVFSGGGSPGAGDLITVYATGVKMN